MDFSKPETFTLWLVVIIFWAAAIFLARVKRGPVSPILLILPVFFLLLGTGINRMHPLWGTYAIAFIHVMMLPALLRIAQSKR